MNRNIAIAEQVTFLGGIDPANAVAGTYTTAAINTNLTGRLLFEVNGGTLGASGTLTFSLLASATSGGSYVAVSGLIACPVISVTGKKVLYEVMTDTLQSLGVGPYVKGQVVVAVATSAFSVSVWGGSDRYLPASDYNATTIQAVVLN